MSKAYSIRKLKMEGDSVAEISRKLEISRDTVYKYLKEDDLSPKMPMRKSRKSIMDDYRTLIESWLDEDDRNWRKQRHSAHRIWVRLREEQGLDVSESTVRNFVRKLKLERGCQKERFLDLDWAPGDAQADFGEADFYVNGTRRRLSYFVLVFPYSNVGLAQVFPSENAECVCQALKDIFNYIAGVPRRIVFDNAAGVGRRIGDGFRTTEMFSAFAAHYGFVYSFCNPYSGHEKGSVERKVAYIRDNLFVPLPQFSNAKAFNERLLDRSFGLSDKPHWLKGERETQLFVEDAYALAGLPATPFSVIRYEMHKADRYGKVKIDGKHLYSSDPAFAGRELVCGIKACSVVISTREGKFICEHPRSYGRAPTDTTNPASQISLLCTRPGAWADSKVRSAIPDGLREHLDSLGKADLKAELRIMRDQVIQSGWETTIEAMDTVCRLNNRLDKASVAISAARIESGVVVYDEEIDLSGYDAAMTMAEGAS